MRSKRSTPAALGSPGITRTRVVPAAEIAAAGVSSSGGSGASPVARHTCPNARSNSATAGPRSSTPVSRQGSRRFPGSPSHFADTHSPDTKPMRPSIAIILRWSRVVQPRGLASWNGLNAAHANPRVAQPAGHSDSERNDPIQSYSTYTATPSFARSASARANSRPTSSSWTM